MPMKKYFLALVLVAGMQVFCTDLLAEQKVGALGRFRPSLGFVTVTVPPGNTIQEILVRTGDVVKKGKKLIVFRSAVSNHAEIEMAELELKEADRMGTKAIEIKKQEIEIAKVEKNFARGMLERLLSGGSDTYSAQLKEEREHSATVADAKWALAADELKRLEANREFTMSKASMKLKAAKKKEESLTVAAPSEGTIMEILQNPGEGSGGVGQVLIQTG